nr:zinc finger SWIM domain-containing protein 7-like [Oncorhynchus nerka]
MRPTAGGGKGPGGSGPVPIQTMTSGWPREYSRKYILNLPSQRDIGNRCCALPINISLAHLQVLRCLYFLPAVSEQIFKDIQKTEEKTLIADDLLIAIRFVFGSCALQALDLVDQRSVTCVSSSSGWTAYQVGSGTGRWCTCYTSCHYCPCPAFTYTVLRKNESLLCKHILVAYLSHAMGLSQQDNYTNPKTDT